MSIANPRDTGINAVSGASSDDASFGSLPAAGSFIGVCISGYRSGTPFTVTSVSDNQGNGNYSLAAASADFYSTQCNERIMYKENIGSPSGTFTISGNWGSSSDFVWIGAEFTGVATSSVVRGTPQTNTATDSATDANVTSDANPLAGDLVLCSALAAIASDTNVTWGAAATTGYTNLGQYPDFTTINSLSADWKEATAGGAQTANWSHDACTGGFNGWGCVIAVFAQANPWVPQQDAPEKIRVIQGARW